MPRQRTPTRMVELREGKVYSSRWGDRTREPCPTGKPTKPKWLDQHGRQFWRDHIVSLIRSGVVAKQDTAILWMACREWQRYMGGDSKTERDDGLRNVLRILPKLGLTPVDRSRVAAGEQGRQLNVVRARERIMA